MQAIFHGQPRVHGCKKPTGRRTLRETERMGDYSMVQGLEIGRETVITGRKDDLTRRDFLAEVVDRLRAELPNEFASFHEKRNQHLLKVYYGNEKVHYEVWFINQPRLIEIGLHFEDGPASTAAYLTYFDQYVVELKHELGPEMELERWTQSWGHVYELIPRMPLSERYAAQIGTRLAKYVSILQPLVEAAGIDAERSAQPAVTGRPWRHFRRGRRGG
jgi:hypothetical protein